MNTKQFSPEVDRQLNALAEACCESIRGDSEALESRATPLLESLLRSGFERAANTKLGVELEKRIAEKCRDNAMHRGGEVAGIARQLQRRFEELARWESRPPSVSGPPQAANLSSAASATSRHVKDEG